MTSIDHFLVYDELPLWSAPFGLTLLGTIRSARNINILDIGSGSGFPMLEIAERFGNSCRVFGVDPSEDTLEMIREKIRMKGITNAEIVATEAENMPFSKGFFKLIVANNGLNNVRDPEAVLKECHRVAASGAQFVTTMNLPHTFSLFYDLLGETLTELGLQDVIELMHQHISAKRKSVDEWKAMISRAGFIIETISVDGFHMKFADGTSFFNHYFIRTAFLPPWRTFLPPDDADSILKKVEMKLNSLATSQGSALMQVPYVCFDCRK